MPSRLRGPLGEEVEDELGAVNDLEFGEVGDGAHLGGGELGVEDQQVRPQLQGLNDQLRQFALAHEKAGIEAGAALDESGRHFQAGGPGQFGQFLHGVFGRGAILAGNADQDGPFPAPALAGGLHPGQFFFQRGHQGGEIQVQTAGIGGVQDGPAAAVQRPGQQVRHLDGSRQAVGAGDDGGHRVQAQQGQVHQVVLGQGAGVQVGVQQPQALEAAMGAALPGQRGNDQPLGVAHQDVGDQPLAVQEHPHLPVQVLREFRQLPGQFRGEQLAGGDLAAVEPLQLPQLLGF